MPRRNGVYRSITTIKVNVLLLDIEKEKTYTDIVEVPEVPERDLLNFIRKHIETDTLKVANVKEVVSKETKQYYISLYDFIKHSEVVK